MDSVPERIKIRQLVHFYKADPKYGRSIAQKLGLDMDKFAPWSKIALGESFEVTAEVNFEG